MNANDIDLVCVVWEPEDRGIVSLKEGKWLMYAWGDFDGHSARVPTVSIDDDDFRMILGRVKDYPEFFGTWDDVPRLLTHTEFPLMERVREAPAES